MLSQRMGTRELDDELVILPQKRYGIYVRELSVASRLIVRLMVVLFYDCLCKHQEDRHSPSIDGPAKFARIMGRLQDSINADTDISMILVAHIYSRPELSTNFSSSVWTHLPPTSSNLPAPPIIRHVFLSSNSRSRCSIVSKGRRTCYRVWDMQCVPHSKSVETPY